MSIRSVLVHVDLATSNSAVLNVAGDVAERFGANALGIAACQPMQIIYNEGYIPGELIEEDRIQTEKYIQDAEARFRGALEGRASALDWRSMVGFVSVASHIAEQARSADLVITSPDGAGSALDEARRASVSDLVMRAGRPVLLVPPGAAKLDLDTIVVGWKDARESRRAVRDAVPLMAVARRVIVAEIARKDDLAKAAEAVGEVSAWLKRHGVPAEPMTVESKGEDSARLDVIARDNGAGVLVAGAYGHSRLREWVMGGVTRDLLLRPERCTLVSH